MLFCEGVDGLVREVVHADEPYPAQFLQTRQFEHRHVCELHTVYRIVSQMAYAGVKRNTLVRSIYRSRVHERANVCIERSVIPAAWPR